MTRIKLQLDVQEEQWMRYKNGKYECWPGRKRVVVGTVQSSTSCKRGAASA